MGARTKKFIKILQFSLQFVSFPNDITETIWLGKLTTRWLEWWPTWLTRWLTRSPTLVDMKVDKVADEVAFMVVDMDVDMVVDMEVDCIVFVYPEGP